MNLTDCTSLEQVKQHAENASTNAMLHYTYVWFLLEHIAKLEYQRGIDEAAEREMVLREALADAIRRPMGVIPTSAEGLLTADELDAAEKRRVATESKEVK